AKIVAPHLGPVMGEDGEEALADESLLTTYSVLFDAVYVPGGRESGATLSEDRDAWDFVTEAYRHCKPLSATGDGIRLLGACPGVLGENGRKRGNGKGASADGVLTAEEPASAAHI